MLTNGYDKSLFYTRNQRIFVDNTPRVPDLPTRNYKGMRLDSESVLQNIAPLLSLPRLCAFNK